MSIALQELAFAGFGPEAFAILDRLRAQPHIEQYRKEKVGLKRWVQDPFKRYRDDLVVHWVLPRRLPFETERNVFSRILKNDFGAGGSHHHLWLAFYRPDRRRVTDLQLAHSLSPKGLTVGLFWGRHMKDVFKTVQGRIQDDPERMTNLVKPLAAEDVIVRAKRTKVRQTLDAAVRADPERLADALLSADEVWIRGLIPRGDVLQLGPALVPAAIARLHRLWPLYAYLLQDERLPT